jgi:hypothetical protein
MDKNQYTSLLYSAIAFLGIDREALFWYIIIMSFDMVLGAAKAVMVPELKFSTKHFFFGMLRKFMLLLIVLFVATLGKGLGYTDMLFITTKVIQLLMISEAISVMYCFKSIWQRKESKPEDFISILIESFIKYLGNKIEKIAKAMSENSSCM